MNARPGSLRKEFSNILHDVARYDDKVLAKHISRNTPKFDVKSITMPCK